MKGFSESAREPFLKRISKFSHSPVDGRPLVDNITHPLEGQSHREVTEIFGNLVVTSNQFSRENFASMRLCDSGVRSSSDERVT